MSAHCFEQSLSFVAILRFGSIFPSESLFCISSVLGVFIAVAGILWSCVSSSELWLRGGGSSILYQLQYPVSASCSNIKRLQLNQSASTSSSILEVRRGSSSVYIGSPVDVILTCGELQRALSVKRLFPNYLQSMTWRRVNLVHSFLPLVSIATFWCVVCAQSDTDGSCNPKCIGRQCARYWWTSMWGFIVTLVALSMDVWGASKASDKSTITNVSEMFFGSALNPLHILWIMLAQILDGRAMLANLREAFGDDVIAPLYPWTKSHIKIISGCKVIVNLSLVVHKEIHNFNAFKDKVETQDLSEALVIGTKVAYPSQYNVELASHGQLALLRSNVELTSHGQLALLRSNVLPPYDELKFLRGNSSLGMAIASAQAIGYIYGVVVRCVQGLQVSPIEAIACILNMTILLKGVFHNFASLSHRPLLLYLLPEEEARFKEECKHVKDFEYKYGGRFLLAASIAYGVLLAMGIFFIVNFRKSLNRACVVPIILFEISLIFGRIQGFVGLWLYILYHQ